MVFRKIQFTSLRNGVIGNSNLTGGSKDAVIGRNTIGSIDGMVIEVDRHRFTCRT